MRDYGMRRLVSMIPAPWFGYMWFEMGNLLIHKRIQGFPPVWGSLREAEWWIDE